MIFLPELCLTKLIEYKLSFDHLLSMSNFKVCTYDWQMDSHTYWNINYDAVLIINLERYWGYVLLITGILEIILSNAFALFFSLFSCWLPCIFLQQEMILHWKTNINIVIFVSVLSFSIYRMSTKPSSTVLFKECKLH